MDNAYGNPYLPPFVRNQPKVADPIPGIQAPVLPTKMHQITSVQGFSGAHQYAASLANGSSEILAESDPNTPRIYVAVVDQNGQRYVQGFRLTPEEEPKPVTMDDLNSKMNEVLERLGQLEAERKTGHDKSNFRSSGEIKSANGNGNGFNRNSQGIQRPVGSPLPAGTDESSGKTND